MFCTMRRKWYTFRKTIWFGTMRFGMIWMLRDVFVFILRHGVIVYCIYIYTHSHAANNFFFISIIPSIQFRWMAIFDHYSLVCDGFLLLLNLKVRHSLFRRLPKTSQISRHICTKMYPPDVWMLFFRMIRIRTTCRITAGTVPAGLRKEPSGFPGAPLVDGSEWLVNYMLYSRYRIHKKTCYSWKILFYMTDESDDITHIYIYIFIYTVCMDIYIYSYIHILHV